MADFEVGDSYYDVLGIPQTASGADIQQAWVEKTKEIHADKTGDSERYEYLLDVGKVLKDEKKRKAYNVLGHDEFIEKYGRRGNKKDIDPEDLIPDPSSQHDTGGSASQDIDPSVAGTSTDAYVTGSAGDPSDTSRGSNQSNSQSSGGHDSSRSDTTLSERVGASIRQALWTAFISPMVRYPVSTRVFAVLFAVVVVGAVSPSVGISGNGMDLIAMIAVTGIAFTAIRWLPDFFGARYPRESTILERIPPVSIVFTIGIGTGIAYAGDLPIVDMVVYSTGISLCVIGLIAVFAALFATAGAVLASGGLLVGGDRAQLKPAMVWSAGLGVIIACGLLVMTIGGPYEGIIVNLLDLESYPWGATADLPTVGVHVPMVATYLLALTVFSGSVGALLFGSLLLFHDPQRHAHKGWAIRPTFWEIAAAAPPITFIWALVYRAPVDAPIFEPVAQHIMTDTGVLEVVGIPFCITIIAFAVRDLVEPRYSEWRR